MAKPRNFSNQGRTYCRPEMKGLPLLQKTSEKHCSICDRRRRGPNHDEGLRHRGIVAAQKAAADKS